jgi:hypothetical protein
MSRTEKPIVFITQQAQKAMNPGDLTLLAQASAIILQSLDRHSQTPQFVYQSLENSAIGDSNHILIAFDVSKGDMVGAAQKRHMDIVPAKDASAWDILRRTQAGASII